MKSIIQCSTDVTHIKTFKEVKQLKNWVKKSIAIVATAALMVPTTSAFAEAPQKTAKNQELVKLASNKERTLKNQKDWISKDTIIVKHSGLDKNVHKQIGSKVIRCYQTKQRNNFRKSGFILCQAKRS